MPRLSRRQKAQDLIAELVLKGASAGEAIATVRKLHPELFQPTGRENEPRHKPKAYGQTMRQTAAKRWEEAPYEIPKVAPPPPPPKAKTPEEVAMEKKLRMEYLKSLSDWESEGDE